MIAADFTLSPDEAHALRQALDNYLPGLRYGLARVKRERERHSMVELDEVLERVRDRLAAWEEDERAGITR